MDLVKGRGLVRRRGAASLLMALACAVSCSKRLGQPVPDGAPPSTVAKVRAITSEIIKAPVSPSQDDSPLAALPNRPDDLTVVEIVLALEEAFHIEIPDQELYDAAGGGNVTDVARHLSVKKLIDIVERRRRLPPAVAGNREMSR